MQSTAFNTFPLSHLPIHYSYYFHTTETNRTDPYAMATPLDIHKGSAIVYEIEYRTKTHNLSRTGYTTNAMIYFNAIKIDGGLSGWKGAAVSANEAKGMVAGSKKLFDDGDKQATAVEGPPVDIEWKDYVSHATTTGCKCTCSRPCLSMFPGCG
ncbi:hypothetical protein K491DRAFT_271266 [Lophiostoma macrostomum CBS 122681]|uniref:Uncharacterized protein n=1 Tax=Lophiostoma macrostomum CBS 122681 TaxID=1314788 RepID=A0A6A6SP51_9PLEO|nr:hypothetical protein K491DRAFT_271266 [Lophiostoma macrostomum CBS 122681]